MPGSIHYQFQGVQFYDYKPAKIQRRFIKIETTVFPLENLVDNIRHLLIKIFFQGFQGYRFGIQKDPPERFFLLPGHFEAPVEPVLGQNTVANQQRTKAGLFARFDGIYDGTLQKEDLERTAEKGSIAGGRKI